MSRSSEVSDHCSQYALSDPAKPVFRQKCAHIHDSVCGRCEELKSVLVKVSKAVENSSLTESDKEDANYTCKEAISSINAWKAHQLRSVNQDKARIDAVDQLNDENVLVVQDWAMKFLPRQYRESQGDWFAKRGFSWHISVVTRRKDDKIETQTFVQVIEQGSQESACVVALMEHVLKTLKTENPEIKTVFYRQDNAGCYHSANTIYACHPISQMTGITIQRLDFSDPQGGKGSCDRFAATLKNHVRAYINEGHDVTTPKQFVEALTSHGGVPGTRVSLLHNPHCTDLNTKLKGISKLNNFKITSDGLTTWRAYGVGDGESIPLCDTTGKYLDYLNQM